MVEWLLITGAAADAAAAAQASCRVRISKLTDRLPKAWKPTSCSLLDFLNDASRCGLFKVPPTRAASEAHVKLLPGFITVITQHTLLQKLLRHLVGDLRAAKGSAALITPGSVEEKMCKDEKYQPLLMYRSVSVQLQPCNCATAAAPMVQCMLLGRGCCCRPPAVTASSMVCM